MIMYHNNLYAFGGFNGYTRLCSGEKYDPFHNRWTPIGDMLSPRSNFTAVVLEDRIFVIGGFDGTTTIAMVEIYNAVTDTWSPGIPMNVNRSALCACVLKNLPNGRDYTYLSHFQHIM